MGNPDSEDKTVQALKSEVAAAYKSLDKADNQIKNLLLERKQQTMLISLLDAGGFISEGKLEEAQVFVRTFKTN